MSGRPSAAGVSPWSSRERRLCDSRARPLTFDRTLLAPAPRWRGSSSHAQPLTASRSHGWVMPVNDSRPACPKIARSQVSPARSLPGSASARRTCRAIAASRFLAGLPGTCSAAHAPIVPACWRRSASQTARRFTSVIFAPSLVRCWIPNSTCTTTSGASPRRLTWPPSEIAGSVSSQCRWPVRGTAVTVLRHRT